MPYDLSNSRTRHVPSLACAALILASMSGCAVHKGPGGQVRIGLDEAELLGQEVGDFRLGDGTEGKLRVLNGRYSVKLQSRFRIIPLDNATFARISAVHEVSGRTLLILEKSERGCEVKTHLLSIRGSEVLSWELGDCKSRPKVTAGEEHVVFDYSNSMRTTRFIYRDARLVRGEIPVQGPLAAEGKPRQGAIPQGAPRYLPGIPVQAPGTLTAAGRKDHPSIAAAGEPAKRPAPVTQPRPTTPLAGRPLEFPTQEQRPVRIVLDK